MSKDTNVSVGPGFPALLTLLFVGLKLTEYIDWSWWWVLSPLWITFGIVTVIAIFAVIFSGNSL